MREPGKEMSRSPGGNVWVSTWAWKGGEKVRDRAPPSSAWVANQIKWEAKWKQGGADDSFVSESWSREEWVQQKTVVQSQSKKVRVIHLQPVGLTVRLSICRRQWRRERLHTEGLSRGYPGLKTDVVSPLSYRLRIKATLVRCPSQPTAMHASAAPGFDHISIWRDAGRISSLLIAACKWMQLLFWSGN